LDLSHYHDGLQSLGVGSNRFPQLKAGGSLFLDDILGDPRFLFPIISGFILYALWNPEELSESHFFRRGTIYIATWITLIVFVIVASWLLVQLVPRRGA